MLTEKEINEIRKFLSDSSNPVFLFDDDCDGTCAYLLLRKYYKKGEGIIVKSSPVLDVDYANKVLELNPDLVVVLDKPMISQEFIDKVKGKIVWLDHHPVQSMSKVNYYNPRKNNDSDNRPTTSLAYSVVKSNLWIAIVGCIFDYYIPDFIGDFIRQYPDLLDRIPKDPRDAMYNFKLGKLIRIFSLNLKGKSKDVKKSVSALEKISTPYEVLNRETNEGKFLYDRYEKLNKEYEELLGKAKEEATKENVFVFIYPSSKTSFTSELSNELIHLYSDKLIIVGRQKDDSIRMSLRSTSINIPELLKEALVGIRGYGGGHDLACGGAVNAEDFGKFIENIKNIVNAKTIKAK